MKRTLFDPTGTPNKQLLYVLYVCFDNVYVYLIISTFEASRKR